MGLVTTPAIHPPTVPDELVETLKTHAERPTVSDRETNASLIRQVFAFGSELGLTGSLTLREIEGALTAGNLPTQNAALNLIRPVCDPTTVHFAGNYVFNRFDHDAFVEMMWGDEDEDWPLFAQLMLAGLLKFMGDFGTAENIFRVIGGRHELLGRGDLIASAALFARHLAREEAAGVSVTAGYGIPFLLQEALAWPDMPDIRFEQAELLFAKARDESPTVPLPHYMLGVLWLHQEDDENALACLEDARERAFPSGPASRYLDFQINRLLSARSGGKQVSAVVQMT